MSQVKRTTKIAALLLINPIVLCAWWLFGRNGYYWHPTESHALHGFGWAVIWIYMIAAALVIAVSYHDEVIRPRKELRRKWEQEKHEKRTASVKALGTPQKWAVGNDQYDAEVIKRYNQNQQKK